MKRLGANATKSRKLAGRVHHTLFSAFNNLQSQIAILHYHYAEYPGNIADMI